MSNQPRLTSRFWLNAATVSARLEERHLNHGDFADELGLSRSYWSQILHRKRPLTPQVRRWLLASPSLTGLTEADLWERVSLQASP
jgi:transcriptional regulator with XRE-family HTH domain